MSRRFPDGNAFPTVSRSRQNLQGSGRLEADDRGLSFLHQLLLARALDGVDVCFPSVHDGPAEMSVNPTINLTYHGVSDCGTRTLTKNG